MALVLTSVAVITGGILAALNQLTKDPIAYQKEKALADGIKTVMACNDLVVAKSDVVKQTDAKGKELVYTIYQTQDKQGKDLGRFLDIPCWNMLRHQDWVPRLINGSRKEGKVTSSERTRRKNWL